MTRKKLRLKINTAGKSYRLHDSPFYKLIKQSRLLSILCITSEELSYLRYSPERYNVFIQKGNNEKERVIEHPREKLEKVHTRIASLMCRIEPPPFLHSGMKGLSHITNAQSHSTNSKVLTTDIKSFFPSTTREMIFRFFYKTLKCSSNVADILADICSVNGHLPTGSRISMPLAFWVNAEMFFELEKLSNMHDVCMTVYVDDVTFSGVTINKLFTKTVKSIISRHGHLMHPRKTVLYKGDDTKVITGVVLSGSKIAIKNQQHKKIHEDILLWKVVRDKYVPASLKNRLLGRLNSLSVVEPRLKDKARSIKNYKPNPQV
ncbi:RNA-directed DNA polymerase [Shewanella sp. M16]|uniref:reverse transcriptase family protein n=1 Tax=Shewanella sp. M16 TaxID=2830837 RepID=UPI001BB0C7AE|nr:reverse transcriptase family protein [Shewanella sp. M16]MBS0043358.1 RNA-directed DNA polymerase [Shewanella sp. M16]QYW06222.1 RNA-directed DNA polymerase [Shewanella phage vB_SspS_MuM16-1]